MEPSVVELSPVDLLSFLLDIAVVRPVFVWGSPGIGKSSIVEKFAADSGLECVTLLGSQLAPEDLIGIPKIENGVSKFFPPSMIVREKPFCLFIDELNIASSEIQKAFYSLILDQRIGEYHLPEGSIIIGAGNRAQDSSLVKQMPTALINRMVHVHLHVSTREWLDWAANNEIHPWVLEFIKERPSLLSEKLPPTTERPFSTPRAWHYVSDGLKSLIPNETALTEVKEKMIDALVYGTVTKEHAIHFKSFIKKIKNKFSIISIINGDKDWPKDPKDRDLLYFLAHSFRSHLIKELPDDSGSLKKEHKDLVSKAKEALKKLNYIDGEYAQLIIVEDEEGKTIPSWMLIEIAKELPRLLSKK